MYSLTTDEQKVFNVLLEGEKTYNTIKEQFDYSKFKFMGIMGSLVRKGFVEKKEDKFVRRDPTVPVVKKPKQKKKTFNKLEAFVGFVEIHMKNAPDANTKSRLKRDVEMFRAAMNGEIPTKWKYLHSNFENIKNDPSEMKDLAEYVRLTNKYG